MPQRNNYSNLFTAQTVAIQLSVNIVSGLNISGEIIESMNCIIKKIISSSFYINQLINQIFVFGFNLII